MRYKIRSVSQNRQTGRGPELLPQSELQSSSLSVVCAVRPPSPAAMALGPQLDHWGVSGLLSACSSCGEGGRGISLHGRFLWRTSQVKLGLGLPHTWAVKLPESASLAPSAGEWLMAERMGSRADRPSLILAPIPLGENTALLPPSLSPLWLSQAVKGNNEIQPVGPGARSGALACVEAVCAGTSAAWQRPEHTPLSPRPGTGPDDTWPQNDDRKRQRTMARGGGGRERSRRWDQSSHAVHRG